MTQRAADWEDEETAVEGFTTITDLLENPMPFFVGQLPQLVEWSMSVVCDPGKTLVVKQSALQVRHPGTLCMASFPWHAGSAYLLQPQGQFTDFLPLTRMQSMSCLSPVWISFQVSLPLVIDI